MDDISGGVSPPYRSLLASPMKQDRAMLYLPLAQLRLRTMAFGSYESDSVLQSYSDPGPGY